MAQIYTFHIEYEGCKSKIWRDIQISSTNTLAILGYCVLASFDTLAYHLFYIEYKGVRYDTYIDDFGEAEAYLSEVKLNQLDINVGDTLEMLYDFGCEQIFSIKVTNIEEMPRGSGTAYPKVIAGEGRGIIDDMPSDELMEIINRTDKNGESDFVITNEFGREMVWDYRNYLLKYDDGLIRLKVKEIKEAYENYPE